MILVADSGSTKTDWIAGANGTVLNSFHTSGFNPFFHDSKFIVDELNANEGLSGLRKKVEKVYFFGAGCSSRDRNEIVKNALKEFFSNADVIVDHDMLGTAIAVCGGSPGIACILGTGSNICYFDGKNIAPVRHGLGYVLGDEGSGSYYGRKLLSGYFYNILPPEIESAFAEEYVIDKETVLRKVYNEPGANVYLASFAKFLSAQKHHPFVQDMVFKGMNEYFETNILSYSESLSVPVHFVGSIAYHFRNIISEIAQLKGIVIGNIIQKPVSGLAEYFLKNGKMP